MQKNIIFAVLFLSIFSSLNALSFRDKYKDYREKLTKERDRVTNSRDLKAETRRWAEDIDKLTKRREFQDEIREVESSFRAELRRVF